tara:strand:- start:15 stop:557 length:543 start_codon:yes stop_codon:yes gene_type:complete
MTKTKNNTIERHFSGDFGLLPIEIWDIIYDMKTRMEWREIKSKVDNRWNDWKFHKDYHILNNKHQLIDDIKSIKSGMKIENYFLKEYPDWEKLPSPVVLAMRFDEREQYDLGEYYNTKRNGFMVIRDKNGFVNKPFKFTNGICVIRNRKWEHTKYVEYENQRVERELAESNHRHGDLWLG